LRWAISNGIVESLTKMEGTRTLPETAEVCIHSKISTDCIPS
jgi:hypothetical protein